PRIERENLDGRVVHLGQGRDREQAIGEAAREQDRRHEQRRRHGPQNEQPREIHDATRAACGSTRTPSRSRSAPSTTTCSPTRTPESMEAASPSLNPTSTGRASTVRSDLNTYTNAPRAPRWMAIAGTAVPPLWTS